MKLLAKKDVDNKLRRENEELIDTNIRLRKSYTDIVKRLGTIKENYEPDKIKKLKEFEDFCKELQIKKSKLLEEYREIDTAIERKKDLYYGLIAKQDLLDEKVYQIKKEEEKLGVRQLFVEELERKWQEKVMIK